MSLINVQGLTFGYGGGGNVFENVSFQLDTDWKLGFVGRNGRGKTTFLNLLAGRLTDYSGKITSSVKFSYFPFAVKNAGMPAYEILSEVCPFAEDWEIIRELSYLDVGAEALYRPFSVLSKGEQTKMLLAGLFLNEGDFLLLDEPANHLDAEGRKAVANYLKKKKGFILVSHDRALLDGCVDHILSINRTDIAVESGNFSSFLENFERQQEFEQKQNARLQADINRLQAAARQTADWSDRAEASKNGKGSSGLKADKGYVGHKAAKMMKRAKCAEARQNKAIEQKSALLKNTEIESSLKIAPLIYRKERLVAFSSVAPLYGGKQVCKPASFEIMRGERIALEGKNGCGKSSLLKILCGGEVAHSGTVEAGSGLIISYVPQDNPPFTGTLSEFASMHGIDESLFKTVLHKMGINKGQFENVPSGFSEGQKRKVLLAKSLCERAHLYIWDEPLNYIDIYSRIQIENLIKEFQPAMLFVEHDAAFRNSVATRVVRIG